MPEFGVLLATPFRGSNEGTPMTISGRSTQTEAGSDAALALGVDALRIGRLFRDPARWPAVWREAEFGRQVELSRRRLAWIRSAGTLAALYAEEPFYLVASRTDVVESNPTRLAYALRWLELRDGATGPSWQAVLA